MNVKALLLLAVGLLPGVALAHHHHFSSHHSHHSADSEWECVRWEADVVFPDADGGADDAGACSCALEVANDDGGVAEPDAGADAGVDLHLGEHCAEKRLVTGCSASSGLFPLAGVVVAFALRRRSARIAYGQR